MRLDPPQLRRWKPIRAALPLLGALALLPAACAEESPPAEDVPTIELEDEQPEVAPAVYATEVAFVGFAGKPLRLYARFVNETSESGIARRYGGWLGTPDGWRPLTPLRDTLPVPRAAWRILPGGPWRVLAAEGEELAGLVYRDTLTEIRLTPDGVVAEWTGETGQREALLTARVQRGDSIQTGLLVFRRSAHVAGSGAGPALSADVVDSLPESPASPRTHLFLLADSLGNGLLVARDASDPDSTAIAWTWVGSVGNEWTQVQVQPPPVDASRALARWQVELSEAGISARFRLEPLREESAADSVSGESWPRPFALQGRLDILGSGQTASGFGVESRG